MNAKDLMIGDLLKTNKDISPFMGKGSIVKVLGTAIEDNVVGNKSPIEYIKCINIYGEEQEIEYVNCEYLEPISLSTDFLIKNRFKQYNPHCFRLDLRAGVFCNVDFTAKEPHVSIVNTCYHVIPICKYIHQFQHAMHLCGIEREIII